MNTNDEVKFVYLQSGQTPATPDAGTVYFNPTTKDISVGDVSFKSQPEVLIYHGTISSDQTQITFDKTRTEIIDEIKDHFGRYYDTHKEVIIVGFWRDGYSSNDYIFRLNNVYWGSTDITLMFETYIRSGDGALGTTTIYKKIELDPSTTSSTASITTKTVYDNPLPYVTSADNGKVLGVTNKSWGTMDIPNELPSVTTEDNGKVAGVVDGNWDTMDIPNELPEVTSADNGNVLAVVNGEWAKSVPVTDTVVFNGVIDGVYVKLSDNKTVGDIITAINNSNSVMIKTSNEVFILANKAGTEKLIMFMSIARERNFSAYGYYNFLVATCGKNSPNDTQLFISKFRNVPVPNNNTGDDYILITRNGGYSLVTYPLAPVSYSDDGKTLVVQNGTWTRQTLRDLKSVQFVNGQALSDADYALIKADTNIRGIYSDASKFIIFELSSCNLLQTEFEFVNYAEGLKATIDTTKVVTIASI